MMINAERFPDGRLLFSPGSEFVFYKVVYMAKRSNSLPGKSSILASIRLVLTAALLHDATGITDPVSRSVGVTFLIKAITTLYPSLGSSVTR